MSPISQVEMSPEWSDTAKTGGGRHGDRDATEGTGSTEGVGTDEQRGDGDRSRGHAIGSPAASGATGVGRLSLSGRRRGAARSARATVQQCQAALAQGPGAGVGAPALRRLRPATGQRGTGRASRPGAGARDAASVDARRWRVEGSARAASSSPASAAPAVFRRTGPDGHQRARLAGGARAAVAIDHDDRRRHRAAAGAVLRRRHHPRPTWN